MTSGTFTRVRLFTDIEDITLDKWLDAENNGQDELAKQILDAGLLVEHMIAEIPLDQNLAENTELRQLTENAEQVFKLTVCFGCNRAFENKEDSKTCPNCGAKLSRPELTPTNLTNPSPIHKKETGPAHDTKKTIAPSTPSPNPSQKDKNQSPPSPRFESNKKHHKNKHAKNSNNRTSPPSTPTSPSSSKSKKDDESEDEDWFSSTGTDPLSHSGKHGVKSH